MNITIIHTLSPEVIELFKGFLNPADSKEPAVAATTPAPAATPESNESTDDSDETILTLDVVRALGTEISQKGEKQKEAVKALLAKFGTNKFTALDTAKYTEFYAELKKIA